MNPHKLYVNFGFWDVVKTDHEEGYFNKAIEAKVRKLDGQKSSIRFVLFEGGIWESCTTKEATADSRLDTIHGQTQQSV